MLTSGLLQHVCAIAMCNCQFLYANHLLLPLFGSDVLDSWKVNIRLPLFGRDIVDQHELEIEILSPSVGGNQVFYWIDPFRHDFSFPFFRNRLLHHSHSLTMAVLLHACDHHNLDVNASCSPFFATIVLVESMHFGREYASCP